MNLLSKYPTIIAQRGEKTTLNANITKKLTEIELAELEATWPGLPKNEQLYCELVGPSKGCTECGKAVKFINFSQGYKELCPVCKKKQTVAASKKSIAETTGKIVPDDEVDDWAKYLQDSGLTTDKWTQHTRAHKVDVWWTVKQSADTKTWMEALYRWVNKVIDNQCKTCGKATRFSNYNEGYKTFCCAACARKDESLKWEAVSKMKATVNKKLAEKNTGKASYCNYELYSDPIEANRKYVNNYNMTLEEFDKTVAVLDWCDATDYVQRYYYHINNIKAQKVCSCGELITNHRNAHCSIGCVNRDESVRDKMKNTMLDKYGVEFNTQREEIKEQLRETFANTPGMTGKVSSKSADEMFGMVYEWMCSYYPEATRRLKIYASGITEKEYYIHKKGEGRCHFYDFVIPELGFAVEYNGEHVHPNPDKLTRSEWSEWKAAFSKEDAETVYARDCRKVELAKERGITVHTVWMKEGPVDMFNRIVTLLEPVLKGVGK